MSVTDPIGDMLTRMRNAIIVGHTLVALPSSKEKVSIAKILKEEGFISGYEVVDGKIAGSKVLRLRLKYVGERRERQSVITGLERISRPGRRGYTGAKGASTSTIWGSMNKKGFGTSTRSACSMDQL